MPHLQNVLGQEEKEEKDRPIAMRMKDICFRYEKEEPDVLDHVALTLYEGEVVSLLGGNGAGKTTLLSVISGTNRPYYGKIEVFGKRLQKYRGKGVFIHPYKGGHEREKWLTFFCCVLIEQLLSL